MSTGIDEARYSATYAGEGVGEEKQYPIDEKKRSQSALSYREDDALDTAPHDDAEGVRLVNDGNPFPPDPNAPEETDQLTVRAVLVGSLLGLIVGASNIYLGLKTGTYSARSTLFPALRVINSSSLVRLYLRCFSVRCYLRVRLHFLTAHRDGCLIAIVCSFAILKPLSRALPTYLGGGYFGPKENCTVQTAATAAGGLTSLFVAAVPAMYHLGLMTTPRQDIGRLFLLTAITAFYGLFFAIPLRKYYIRECFSFPKYIGQCNVDLRRTSR